MADIQLPPYLTGKELDEQTLGELEVWLSDMSELVNSGTLVDVNDGVAGLTPSQTAALTQIPTNTANIATNTGNIATNSTAITDLQNVQTRVIATQAEFDALTPSAGAQILTTAAGIDLGSSTMSVASTVYIYTGTEWVDIASSAAITAINNAVLLRAPIADPTFTGVPAAPTATRGTGTTQLATTAFVQDALSTITGLTVTNVNAQATIPGTWGAATQGQILFIEVTGLRLPQRSFNFSTVEVGGTRTNIQVVAPDPVPANGTIVAFGSVTAAVDSPGGAGRFRILGDPLGLGFGSGAIAANTLFADTRFFTEVVVTDANAEVALVGGFYLFNGTYWSLLNT